ncbi:Pr6Pr family membrane protein [Streptomyces sp. NPDC002784]
MAAVIIAALTTQIVLLSGAALWCTIAFHYVAPPATFLGWLVFGPRGQTDWPTLAWSFAWPLGWIGYTLVRGATTGWYPYPFLDVGAVGYPVALRNVAVVLAIGAVLALALRWIDRLLARSPRPT